MQNQIQLGDFSKSSDNRRHFIHCYVTFNHWNDKPNVNCNRNENDWNDNWWVGGVRKPLYFPLVRVLFSIL